VEYLYETYETVRLQKIWKNGSKSIRKVYGKRLSRLESEYRSNFRTPDVAAQFLPGGENGLSHSFRWRELRRWGRRCRLPVRAEFGALLE
jgi:hypothetical protein